MRDPDRTAEWKLLRERNIFEGRLLNVANARVRLPNASEINHLVVRFRTPTVGVAVHDQSQDAVLMMWRHRFIPDRWGWEFPAGMSEPGEDVVDAAVRETVEESGLRPTDLRSILQIDVSSGLMDEEFHGFYATSWSGDLLIDDANVEASHLRWIPVKELRRLVTRGGIHHGHSLSLLMTVFWKGLLGT